MAKMNKSSVLKYLKTFGKGVPQEIPEGGDFWTHFYQAGCSGRTDYYIPDLPGWRFCQVHSFNDYDWRTYREVDGKEKRVSTVGTFEVIQAHQAGQDVVKAFDYANAMGIAGYVDYIRPGAPSDYGPRG